MYEHCFDNGCMYVAMYMLSTSENMQTHCCVYVVKIAGHAKLCCLHELQCSQISATHGTRSTKLISINLFFVLPSCIYIIISNLRESSNWFNSFDICTYVHTMLLCISSIVSKSHVNLLHPAFHWIYLLY